MLETRSMEALAQELSAQDFTRAAPLQVSALHVLPEVREMCAANRCGAYGKTWACPPGCGSLEECARQIEPYTEGVLVQTVGQLEDSFDLENMEATAQRHRETFLRVAQRLRETYPQLLALGAGGCTLCETCTYPDAPCRQPERRMASMESYGLMVSEVCNACGLPYISGANTVTYSGCYLLR